jgi:hypothetical protein
MNATDVIGYTANASVWCPECAKNKYGAAACGICPKCDAYIYPIALDICLECGFDYSGCNMTDDEGNPVCAIFAMDEWYYRPCCCHCGAEIDVSVLTCS